MSSSKIDVTSVLNSYSKDKITISCIASHSALDVFDGARDEGFKTIAICQKGREKTYTALFPGLIGEVLILEKFVDVVKPEIIGKLIEKNTIFIPNRSFAVYVGYENIERYFTVPVFGNRYLLRYEERVGEKNYYRILDLAGIKRPRTFGNPDEIDRPVIVKIPHAIKRVERGFFIAVDRDDFYRRFNKLVQAGVVRKEDIDKMSIEEFVLGAHFNVNYFYSVAYSRLELISIDRRIQSDIDGFIRLPADIQIDLKDHFDIEMIEVGHIPVTMRESLLERVYEIGEKFVDATRKIEPPGIIGPFTLQLMITKNLEPVVYDVAPRIGGGTNAYMGIGSQYSKLYFGRPISLGRRIAIEIKECARMGCLSEIVT
ncbi:MAG: formate--phosphoribosylaminoimidazolecarboxamide ligase family protein [Desulfurococcaceae archaeon]